MAKGNDPSFNKRKGFLQENLVRGVHGARTGAYESNVAADPLSGNTKTSKDRPNDMVPDRLARQRHGSDAVLISSMDDGAEQSRDVADARIAEDQVSADRRAVNPRGIATSL